LTATATYIPTAINPSSMPSHTSIVSSQKSATSSLLTFTPPPTDQNSILLSDSRLAIAPKVSNSWVNYHICRKSVIMRYYHVSHFPMTIVQLEKGTNDFWRSN
jgi:hypothetical protein